MYRQTHNLYYIKMYEIKIFVNNEQELENLPQIISICRHAGGCPRDVIVKALDCGIVVSEFELQSRYYVNLWTNTLGKGINPLIPLAMG